MNKYKLRRLAAILLEIVLLLSVGNLVFHFLEYRWGEETYEEAESMVELPDFSSLPTPPPVVTAAPAESETPTPVESEGPAPTPYIDPYADALSAMDFAALQEVNDEVIGWVVIPGTTVSYPLLQTDDNQYYLNHTWRGERNTVGAIFMEHTNDPALTDFHTILYGHNVKNGSMFGALQSYRDQSYVDEHPSVYIAVDSGTYRYDIFAVYQADVDSSTYQIGFSGAESRQTFLEDCMSRSLVTTGVTPHTYDRILTLSTCTNTVGMKTIRWVVQAVCYGEAPALEVPSEDQNSGELPTQEETPAPEDDVVLPPGM